MGLRLQSLAGLFIILGLAWLLSKEKRHFPVRTVVSGVALQFAFALFILKTPTGASFFQGINDAIARLNDFSMEGAAMVFGPLASTSVLASALGPANSFIFAINVTATIIFVSALSSLFYHWGILQRAVGGMAWVMQRVMGTSGSESLAAAANIFLGQTEAALVIKPYISRMTTSEIMALMVPGMATIATGVLGVYAGMGVDAGHLVTASILSTPAALLVAKIMVPEREKSDTASGSTASVPVESVNSVDALCKGASEGMGLSINVLGMLIAFVAAVALANHLLGWVQTLVGISNPVTMQYILGVINWPFAWAMGVPASECLAVGQLLGERIVLNEFVAYLDLTKMKSTMDPRTFTIATYALCGFANFASIAIQIGGIGALAPERRGDLARLGMKAMVGGLIACYLTASIIGVLL